MNQIAPESGTILSRMRAGKVRWLIAELFIVILGVFIALAIDEWREDIDESARELEYLTQLIRDLQTTEDLMNEAKDTGLAYQGAAKKLLAAFESEKRLDLDQTRQLLADMRFFYFPAPKSSTAEGMVATGEFRLIKDRSVRAKVTDYVSFVHDHNASIIDRSERARELLFQVYILAQTYGISPGHFKGHHSTLSEPDTPAFFADPKAYIYLAAFIENKDIILGPYANELSKVAQELREVLEQYISSR